MLLITENITVIISLHTSIAYKHFSLLINTFTMIAFVIFNYDLL